MAQSEDFEKHEKIEDWVLDTDKASRLSHSPVSLDPPTQSRILAELQLMITVTANSFLLDQANIGRLDRVIVNTTRRLWEAKMPVRPAVIEFLFDGKTQRTLVVSNVTTILFPEGWRGNAAKINSTLWVWGIVDDQLAMNCLCFSDYAITQLLYDSTRILQMLNAPVVTISALQDLQLKTQAKITERQAAGAAKSRGPYYRGINGYGPQGLYHRRDLSDGGPSDRYHGLEYAVANMPAPPPLPPALSRRYKAAARPATPEQQTILDGPGPTVRKGDTYIRRG